MYQNYGGIKVFRPITFRELVGVGEVGFYSTPLTDDTPPSQSVSWQSLPVLWWAYSWNVQTTWWEVQMKSETA